MTASPKTFGHSTRYYLVTVHIDMPSDQECTMLGSASDLPLRLSNLQQLSLRGFIREFLEQSVRWQMPSPRVFSIDFGISQYESPDVVVFLTTHGLNLVVLDLKSERRSHVDAPTILDICPALTTFTFNADWRINRTCSVSNITKRPYPHTTTIVFHGLFLDRSRNTRGGSCRRGLVSFTDSDQVPTQ